MIYLDHSATTPCAPEVVEAMLPYFTEKFGNPSSNYALGWQADEAVKKAREQVAEFLGVRPDELIFTSGATESINLVIQGTISLYREARPGEPLHIITVATEHSAVLETCQALKRQGVDLSVLGVNQEGLLDLDELRATIKPHTVMLAVMLANNETGVLQDIPRIAGIAQEHRLAFLSDTTQAIGKIDFDLSCEGLSFACVSGHKIYGPKGVGVLYVSSRKPRARLNPLIFGGGQQSIRSGTLNVPGIIGLGVACQLAGQGKQSWDGIRVLRDQMEEILLREIPGAKVHSRNANRLPNVSNIGIPGVQAKELIAILHNQLAVSLGSACHAGSNKPSHVLRAMNVEEDLLYGSIRISLGRDTSEAEVQQAIKLLKEKIEIVKKQSI